MVEILSLRQHEIAPVGVSFVTSVKEECWDWVRTSKPRNTMKNTDSPRSPQAPTAGAVDLESAQPPQSTGYHSNSGCRPPAVSRHIITSLSHTHTNTYRLNGRRRWRHTCTKFCTPNTPSKARAHSVAQYQERVSPQSRTGFLAASSDAKAFCRKHAGLFLWMF